MTIRKDILAKFRKRNEGTTSDEPETAIQQFNAVVDFINSFGYIVGMEFTSDWQFNYRAIGSLLMNFCLDWVECYTFYMLFPNIECVTLSSGCMFSITITLKMSLFAIYHGRFMSIINFVYKLARENTEGRRELILFNTAKTIFYHFKLVVGGLLFGAGLYMFYPVYDYVINGNLTPVSPLIFPFAAGDSIRDYFISTLCNLIPPTVNVVAVATVSCIFMTFVDVYGGLISLIEEELRTFDGMWLTKHQNNNLRKLTFRNLMVEITDLARYNVVMNDLFSLITTVQISCGFFGITTAIFAYLATNFLGGIGAALYYTTELMMFCFIGQLMENESSRIEMILYNTNWYVYDEEFKKDLLFALCVVQDLKSIAVAGIMPLNFETGVVVAKNIYSIIMFLLEALE